MAEPQCRSGSGRNGIATMDEFIIVTEYPEEPVRLAANGHLYAYAEFQRRPGGPLFHGFVIHAVALCNCGQPKEN